MKIMPMGIRRNPYASRVWKGKLFCYKTVLSRTVLFYKRKGGFK